MCEKLIVENSFGEIIREEKYSKLDFFVKEPIFILNTAKKIDEIYISKEFGLKLRNLNEKEVNNCYVKIKEDLLKAMSYSYEKLEIYNKIYDCNCHELDIDKKMYEIREESNFDFSYDTLQYIYAKAISMYGSVNVNDEFVKEEDFKNIEKTATKLAKDLCSHLIVLEVESYKKLYNIMKNYYNLDDDVYKMNFYTEKFIYNFMKLINILFLETDAFRTEEFFYFKIVPYENFKFEIYNVVQFFDGYIENWFEDKIVSNNLKKIDKNYIDTYIKDNKQNLNNLLFIVSRLYMEWDNVCEFNYKEYNLSLVSILELLLVNSKDEKDIKAKFVKNILLCLAITDINFDNKKEEQILKSIYNYRSCILHGNYSGYKNALSDLEKYLNYKPLYFETAKYNTVEFLISQKLNHYVSNIFKIMSSNNTIIEILKN